MADREKVIKAIELHLSEDGSCDACTYVFDGRCVARLFKDALALLKEQANTMNKLRGAMEDMKDGIASEAVSYLLTLMDKLEGR